MAFYFMKEDEAYLEIAERFIESCDGHIKNSLNIQEVIGFKAYHAFECLGGAFNSHYGYNVPKGHAKKINAFVINSRKINQVNSHNVAMIGILVSSLRNKYLYPETNGSDYKSPKDQLSLTDARKIVSKVKGVLRQVKKIV